MRRGAWLFLAAIASHAQAEVVQVNYGYFHEPGAHLWTYGVNAHTWTDPATNITFKYTFWPQTSGAKVIKKLQNGELDIAHLGSAPYASGSLRGVPMKMLYVINLKELSQCLVARFGLNTPPDLKGKKVAYIGGSTTHFMLNGMLLATGLTTADFGWIGHMEARNQMAAWDKGEIDAGFMWGGGMWHLQNKAWCSAPDPSSPGYRGPCPAEAANVLGHNVFTSGMSKVWGREVWTNLAVADAFAARYPQTVYRSVKLVSVIDTKFVRDSGFFTNSPDMMCGLVRAVGRECTAEQQTSFAATLSYDAFLTWDQQKSGQFIGEKVDGSCLSEQIGQHPNNDGPCNKDTASGSAYSAWSASEFAYKLKSIGYLPSLKYFDYLMDSQYIDAVGDPALDKFPEITAESLAAAYTPNAPDTDTAFNHCGDMAQPIALTSPGLFRDHDGGGFHQDGKRCDWQINAGGPVLLTNINIKIERDQDKFYIYEGLCTGAADDCVGLPLLASFTGGKGWGPLTLHNGNPRPPIMVPNGQATISFVPDPTADKALTVIYDDGVSMEWSLAPTDGTCGLGCQNGGTCNAGICDCVDGWGGADCSSPTCVGTVRRTVGQSAGVLVNGINGTRTAHNADCRWELAAQNSSHVIVAEIQSLDLDWVFDPLSFYDGAGVGGTHLGTYSGYFTFKLNAAVGDKCPGPMCPGYVVSGAPTMTVRWSSDAMDSGEGFRLRYFAASLADVICGPGSLQGCSGHGTCSPAGCVCDENWYGQFCQLQQCSGETLIPVASTGSLRNMAVGQASYAPNRDCRWVLRAPTRDGVAAGSIAIYLETFDLENNDQSSDSLILSSLGTSGTTLTGSSAPCTAPKADRASCKPFVVLGDQVEVRFKTDMNDYPPSAKHAGFLLHFVAEYDCTRRADGKCIALTDCASVGMVAGNVACVKCPPHQYFDGQGNECRLCASGQVPDAQQLSCDFCPPGRVAPDSMQTNCTLCGLGKFAAQRGMTQCADCEPGTFSRYEEQRECEPAQPGFFVSEVGARQEVPCLPGTITSERGSLSCRRCQAGTSQPTAGRSACDRCGRGTFANYGAVTCTPCPSAPQVAMTTEETGTSIVEQCGCPENSFRDKAPNSTLCRKCPPGMVCPFGSDEQSLYGSCSRLLPGRSECVAPLTIAGYMTLKDSPLSVWQCESRFRCPGGLPGTCAPLLTHISCQHCLKGYEWDGRECMPCREWERGIFLFPVLPIVLVPLVVLFFYKMFGDTIERWGSWQNGTASLGFILLNHFQVITIMRGVNMETPAQLGQTLAVLSISSDFTGLFRAECTVYAKFTDSVPLKACGPFIVLAAFIVVWGLSQVVAGVMNIPHLAMEKNRTINAFLSIIFAFFGAIVELAFALFKCVPNPNGEDTLSTDRSVVCGSADWTSMLAFGIGAVLIWCVGFGGVLLRTIIYAPDWFVDRNVQMRWKFLFIKYRPDVHWWAMVIILKGILLQQGQLFLKSGVDQLFYLMSVLLVYVTLVSIYRPWRHLFVNFADAFAHICMIMSSAAMLSFAVDRLTDEERVGLGAHMSTMSSVWIFLVIPPVFLAWITMFTFQSSWVGKEYLRNSQELIREAFALVHDVGEDEFNGILEMMGEVDLFFCRTAAATILAELGGKKFTFRVSTKAAVLGKKLEVRHSHRRSGGSIPQVTFEGGGLGADGNDDEQGVRMGGKSRGPFASGFTTV